MTERAYIITTKMVVRMHGVLLLCLCMGGVLSGVVVEECDDFYQHVCHIDPLVAETSSDSIFGRIADHHNTIIHDLLDNTESYQSCMAYEPVEPPTTAFADTLLDDARGNVAVATAAFFQHGFLHPIHLDVVPSLHELTYAVDLSLNPSLYAWYMARLDDGRTTPTWMQSIYESHPMQQWTQAMAHRAAMATDEDEDAAPTLDDYVANYQQWGAFKALISRRSAKLLEDVFGEGLTDDTWLHCNGMPAAVIDVALIATMDGAVWEELRELTLSLLQESPPRGYLARARAVVSPRASYTRSKFLPAPRRALWQHFKSVNADTSDAESDAMMERQKICRGLTRASRMAHFNRLFLEALPYDAPKLQRAVHELASLVRESVAEIVHENSWIHARTRNAALHKLNNMAIYVLTKTDKQSEPYKDAHYITLIRQWLATDWYKVRSLLLVADEHVANHRWHLDTQFLHEVNYEIVNAWYNPLQNTITIPPGILWDRIYTGDHVNDLATLGMILGHEMGHALDVGGRMFDAQGRYVSGGEGWWHHDDTAEFGARMACLAADFGHPCGREDYGMHTMGEDMADQMGLRASYRLIVENSLHTHDGGADADVEEMSDSDLSKQFFTTYAELWCARMTHERECEQVSQDVHALPRHRVNKSLRQFAPFRAVFECPAHAPMVNAEMCVVY